MNNDKKKKKELKKKKQKKNRQKIFISSIFIHQANQNVNDQIYLHSYIFPCQ